MSEYGNDIDEHIKSRRNLPNLMDSNYFYCPECGLAFKSQNELQGHIKSSTDISHFKLINITDNIKSKEKNEKNPILCRKCGKKFVFEKFKKHLWDKHNISMGKRKIESQTHNLKPKDKLIIAIEEPEKPIAEYSFSKKDPTKVKKLYFEYGQKYDRVSENFKNK